MLHASGDEAADPSLFYDSFTDFAVMKSALERPTVQREKGTINLSKAAHPSILPQKSVDSLAGIISAFEEEEASNTRPSILRKRFHELVQSFIGSFYLAAEICFYLFQ